MKKQHTPLESTFYATISAFLFCYSVRIERAIIAEVPERKGWLEASNEESLPINQTRLLCCHCHYVPLPPKLRLDTKGYTALFAKCDHTASWCDKLTPDHDGCC